MQEANHSEAQSAETGNAELNRVLAVGRNLAESGAPEMQVALRRCTAQAAARSGRAFPGKPIRAQAIAGLVLILTGSCQAAT
jgi:hypothetical protein